MKTQMSTLIAVCGTIALTGLFAQSSQAHSYDDDSRGARCSGYSREVIRATGVSYPARFISERSAIKAWRREAQSVYGREFNWDCARNRHVECEPYKLTVRCTAAANPRG